MWQNMGESEMMRWFRSIVTWIIAIVIIAVAFLGIIFFKSLARVD